MYSAVRTHDYPEYPESESMDDRESLYFDTISLADSEAAAAAAAHRKSLSQSRNTIYHSAVDLASDETTPSRRVGGSLARLDNAGGSFGKAGIAASNAYNYSNNNNNNNRTSTLWTPNYRHSCALDHYNGGSGVPGRGMNMVDGDGGAIGGGGGAGGDAADAAIASQVIAMHNGQMRYAPITAATAAAAATTNIAGGGPAPGGFGVAGSGFGVGIGGDAAAAGAGVGGVNCDEVSRRLLQSNTSSCTSTKDKKLPITYSQWKFRTRRRFADGLRSVDFVLAYNGSDHELENIRKRETFEANLQREGLQLEYDKTQRIHFIKLHAPIEVLCQYAEILKIKLPMRKLPGEDLISYNSFSFGDTVNGACRCLCRCLRLDRDKFPVRPQRIYCEFSRQYQELFDWEQPALFDAGLRNLIINFILERQHFIEGEETPDNLGIEKLVEDGVYECAYTLHDDTDRDLLLSEWANVRNCMKLQPLDSIKDYFGPKVALYFAWLGFYAHMLIPLSIYGLLCFIYGFITWSTDPISTKICTDNNQTLMCPQCDRNCDYWKLEDTCKSAKMNYLIDNNTTIAFALAMSIWSVLYLELWKRYAANLVHRWGLTGFSQHIEHPRPQYLAKLRKTKALSDKHEIPSNVLEPDVPYWSTRFLPNFTSYSIMVLFMCISVIAIFSMIVYRMAQRASHSILGNEDSTTYKIMVLPMTAGIIDLIVISLLDYVYSYLAVYLTNLEYCRTQTEYDESLTVKNYIFQFVNYYSSLFYIAFLKGKFVGYPAKYNRIFGFRQEECAPGGCLMELCVQLIIIMVGKQAVNAIVEMLIPYLMRTIRKYCTQRRESEEKLISCNQWTEDYHLEPWTNNSLFSEYLEMVLQYGFITLFSLAFPLAPLLALINNVIEVRLDAIKMLNFTRRPVAQRARNIGVWFNIMTVVTKIAVASSAMIIAFSTNLIPKIVYITTTNDESLEGYLNFTLAYFNTEDFQDQPKLSNSPYANVTSCRYTEFRNPPWHEQPYKRPMFYWKILTGRLAFIVIYQNIISMIQAIISWAIPDQSERLRKRIKREDFLMREHIIDYEKMTVKKNMINKVVNAVQNKVKSRTGNERPDNFELDTLRKRFTATNSGSGDSVNPNYPTDLYNRDEVDHTTPV